MRRALYTGLNPEIVAKSNQFGFGVAMPINLLLSELWYPDSVFLVDRKDLKTDYQRFTDTKEYPLAPDYDEPLALPSQLLKEWIGKQSLEEAYDSYEAAGFSEAEALGIFLWREKMLEIISKYDRLPSVIEQAQAWESCRKEGVLWARLNNYKLEKK